jgi:acyl dehydratase
MTLLTEEVKAWIGREVTYESPDELGRASIRYFALAIGDDNPLYFDDEYARANGYDGVIAPPTLVCETNQFIGASPNRDADGYLGHTWDLPVSGCRLVRGGNDYEFFRPVRPDDRITVTWRLAGITERTSSSGAPMLVVSSDATYTSRGETVAVNKETLIYQAVQR